MRMTDKKDQTVIARSARAVTLAAMLLMCLQAMSAEPDLIASETVSMPNHTTLAQVSDSSSQVNAKVSQKPTTIGGGKSIPVQTVATKSALRVMRLQPWSLNGTLIPTLALWLTVTHVKATAMILNCCCRLSGWWRPALPIG